jgi:hypothetical protein
MKKTLLPLFALIRPKTISILVIFIISFSNNLMAQDTVNQLNRFTDFIQKAEINQTVQQYFVEKENFSIKLTSRDVNGLNNFLKTNRTIFGHSLINGENSLNDYVLVDFNVMYSNNTILIVLKEIGSGEVVGEKTISINY